MIKSIYGFTTSRADFGILKYLYLSLEKDKLIDFKLIVSGSHFNKRLGNTYKEIERENFRNKKLIKIKSSFNTNKNSINYMSLLMNQITDLFKSKLPDSIIVLGDRYEMFAITIVAHFYNIPIIHLHGGELTFGSLDDAFRHSITKMSTIHFVSTQKYKKRIIQLGEKNTNVFNVGSLSCEQILNTKFISLDEINKKLKINIDQPYFVVAYHPETKISIEQNIYNMKILFNSLQQFTQIQFIFSFPNADPGNKFIIDKIIQLTSGKHSNFFVIKNLGYFNFINLLKYSRGIIGNSSSGIIEAPSLKIPTLNIGNRQNGREKAKTIYDCDFNKNNIIKLINKFMSANFLKRIKKFKNPYENKETTNRIISIIHKYDFKNTEIKKFYDL